MGRRKNIVNVEYESTELKKGGMVSLADAKLMFLRDQRGLAKQTQRWHKENLMSFEKILKRLFLWCLI